MTIQLGDSSANPFLTDVVSQSQTVGALNAQVLLQLRGQSTCTIQVTAIGSQTLVFEGTTDAVNFYALTVFPIGGFSGAPITSTTATGQWIFVCAGMYQIRTRCSAYTSGTATVSMVASQGTNEQQVTTGITQAATTAGQLGTLVQGAVTTAAPAYTTAQTDPLSLTTAGGLRVDVNSIIGTTAVASSGGVLKVGIAGGAAGAAIDGAIAAAPPANALQIAPKAASANPANATAGNAVALFADLAGRLVITPVAPRLLVKGQATTISATGATTIVTAGAAGVFNDISYLVITTAGLAAQTITISDGTLSWIIDYPNATLAPGNPATFLFDPPLSATTAATAWTANQSAATACHYLVVFAARLG
jgi:hypothetical protein